MNDNGTKTRLLNILQYFAIAIISWLCMNMVQAKERLSVIETNYQSIQKSLDRIEEMCAAIGAKRR